MSVIELIGVSKEYESGSETVMALSDVDFSAERGKMVTIVGPSGSGKSTLLNMIGLLDTPTAGVVRLDGRDVTDFSEDELTEERRTGIGFVFQDYHLLPMFTAVENVELPSRWDTSVDRHDRAIDLLERVGLGDRLDHRPDQLSGGQRQRVAIARSLINEPEIVLADEPTGNLDQATGRSVLSEFRRICDEEGVAVVTVTHDPLVADYADREVELVDGVLDGG